MQVIHIFLSCENVSLCDTKKGINILYTFSNLLCCLYTQVCIMLKNIANLKMCIKYIPFIFSSKIDTFWQKTRHIQYIFSLVQHFWKQVYLYIMFSYRVRIMYKLVLLCCLLVFLDLCFLLIYSIKHFTRLISQSLLFLHVYNVTLFINAINILTAITNTNITSGIKILFSNSM